MFFVDTFRELLRSEVFLLFFVISLGKLLERVKVRQLSLGIASIFLIAAVLGHAGHRVPQAFGTFGLVLFVYCVGIEAGPQVFSSVGRRRGHWLSVLLLHLGTTAALTLALAALLHRQHPAEAFIGVFAGAMTCTPGLASVLDRIEAPAASAVFGAVYPIALLGGIYLLPALPALFRDDVEKLKRDDDATRQREHRPRAARAYRIENPNVAGRRVEEVRRMVSPHVVFSRYAEGERHLLASDGLVLAAGGSLVAVSPEAEVASLEILLGPSEAVPPHPPAELVSRKLIVSRAQHVGLTLAELDLEARLDVRVTRVVRSGVELSPLPERQLLLGDRLVAIGTAEDMAELSRLLGDDVQEAFRTQFAPISIGVVLGFFLGRMPLPWLDSPLGITGGVLVVSLFLGYRVKMAGILWQIPQQTTAFLKQLGLYIFFAVLGTNTGPALVETVADPGSYRLLLGALAVCFLPLLLTYAVATRLLRRSPLETVGLLAGSLNSSSALQATNESLRTDIPSAPFALAYPFGLLFGIAATQAVATVLQALSR